MKKIMMSLAMIVAVGAVVAISTGAFFNDTETSKGNTFSAGAIDLLVDSEAHYNGMVCIAMDGGYFWADEDQTDGNEVETSFAQIDGACEGSWNKGNLDNDQTAVSTKFFNYSDLKPGDWGENTISLHVYDNDSYVCAIVDKMVDYENGCTEPERDVDGTCAGTYGEGMINDGDGEGDLSTELKFLAWADTGADGEIGTMDEGEGDNVWQTNEAILFSNDNGPASDILDGKVYPMFTPDNGMGALAGDTTFYLGMYWCYGTISYVSGALECDGSQVTNLTQTDAMMADIGFVVEQSRHNEGFTCPELESEVCEYSVVATGVSYEYPLWGTVTRVTITNEDCSVIEDVIKVEHTISYQQGQPEGERAGWAGISCIEPGYSQVVGGGVWDGAAYAQGPAEPGAAAIDEFNYPVYPHHTFTGGEEAWVVEAAGAVPPTGIYALCATVN